MSGSLKQRIKYHLPDWVRRFYNRVVSRRIIRRKIGSWFDIDWNRTAAHRTDSDWVQTYDASWEHWQGSDLSPADLERLRRGIGSCTTLLDAGCGDGFLLENLRDLADACAGVDLSLTGLQLARQRLGSAPLLVQSFLEALPFPNRAFDTVVCTHTLEHVKELHGAVAELKRIAARKLIVLVPCQEEVLYSEDYHIHYFPEASEVLELFALPGARCERYTVPEGVCAYAGDVLMYTVEMR